MTNTSENTGPEGRLEWSLNLVANAFGELDEIFYIFDPETGLIRWNDRLTDVTGYSDAEINRMETEELFREEDREEIQKALEQVVGDGESGTVQAELATEEGGNIPYEISGVPIPDASRFDMLVAGVGRDISERLERKRRLENQNDQLKVLNRLLRHEVRNDMQVMLGDLETLEERSEGGKEVYESLRSNVEEIVYLTKIARRITNSMIEGETNPQPIPLDEVVEGRVEKARMDYEGASIDLEEEPPSIEVAADELLGIAIGNLIQNSVKHSDNQTPNVDLSFRTTDDYATVEVSDDGPGIPETLGEDVYELGAKGRESQGTGLGLFLVKSLVENYGGDLQMESGDGGTTAKIQLERAE